MRVVERQDVCDFPAINVLFGYLGFSLDVNSKSVFKINISILNISMLFKG